MHAAPGRTIQIDDGSGGAAPLATKQDLLVLKAAIASATIAVGAGGAAAINAAADAAVSPATWPVGTTVIEGK
jgi:hypothetical protein